jgi:hypothetical protein
VLREYLNVIVIVVFYYCGWRSLVGTSQKPHSISPKEASSGDEGEERVGPIIYSGKYLFNKSKCRPKRSRKMKQSSIYEYYCP